MGSKQQVGAVAHRGPDLPHKCLTAVERLQRRLPGPHRCVGAGRVELDRVEALLHVGHRPLCSELGVGIDLIAGVTVARIQVGVAAHPVTDPTAEQIVNRPVKLLAHDVPAGDFDAAENARHRHIGPLGEPSRVQRSEQQLNTERVGALHPPFEHVGHHVLHRCGVERHRIDLAVANHTGVGGELHEDEVAPPVARRRVTHHERLHLGQFHADSPGPNTMMFLSARPAFTSPIASLMSSRA